MPGSIVSLFSPSRVSLPHDEKAESVTVDLILLVELLVTKAYTATPPPLVTVGALVPMLKETSELCAEVGRGSKRKVKQANATIV